MNKNLGMPFCFLVSGAESGTTVVETWNPSSTDLVLLGLEVKSMDESPGKLKIIPDHFQLANSTEESPCGAASVTLSRSNKSLRSLSSSRNRRKSRSAFMFNFLTLRRLPWVSGSDREEKVELTAAEVESLRSELEDLEEREAHFKAQLEHVDEILRSAVMSGYLYIRTRWTALPGELPPLDETDVDDWLSRFLVLHGTCIYLYLLCTDISPQDSALLSDIVQVGELPSYTRDDDETRYAFYILTRQGLRYECSSASKIQVNSWLSALHTCCKLEGNKTADFGFGTI